MTTFYQLDFEKPVIQLERQIHELEAQIDPERSAVGLDPSLNFDAEVKRLAEATRVEIKGNKHKVSVRTGLPSEMDEDDHSISIDVIITMPSVMGKLGPLGRILGPRGLMPNPKTGTVTMDVAKAVSDVKAGKIDFRVDKTGIVHAAIGKVSFPAEKIAGNAKELIDTLVKMKPAAAKGVYMKSIYMSSTMSPSVQLDPKAV